MVKAFSRVRPQRNSTTKDEILSEANNQSNTSNTAWLPKQAG